MAIDLSQFKQTFIEESDEGLDVLESGLLALETGDADDETIHAVFRAAHSIKGGAGTFGLNEIASFTHVMETLLDEMRDGRRAISKEAINLLLNSVDILRELMDAARDDMSPDMERADEGKAQLDALLAGVDASAIEGSDDAEAVSVQSGTEASEVKQEGWILKFHPHEHMLRTGNDTVRMFKELASLGDMENTVNFSGLPEIIHMDPEMSYLSWVITLKNNDEQGEINKAAIEEIFEWVDDDCDLNIEPLMSEVSVGSDEAELIQADGSSSSVDGFISAEGSISADGSTSSNGEEALQSHIDTMLSPGEVVVKEENTETVVIRKAKEESQQPPPPKKKPAPVTVKKKKKNSVEGSIR
ncbi:MAG: hypothetical protein GY694_12365, partial [Gammaproteobacteria bacterium]|nr:hypothetical protein [Gammaproteobacteria bacterium]